MIFSSNLYMSITQYQNKDLVKRKIIYRSRNMGFKELEIVFDRFLCKYLSIFDLDELLDLYSLLNNHDQEIYEYIYHNKLPQVQIESKILDRLISFINSDIIKK